MMEKLFAYRKVMIMNSLKRSVPNIVMFTLADLMLAKDLQEIISKHEIERAWLGMRGTLHLQYQH